MRPVLLAVALLLAHAPARAAGDDWDALSRAVGEADLKAVVAALPLGRAWSPAADTAVLNGLVSACGDGKALGKAVHPVFAELIRHGYDLNRRDERGNTLLISAAQTCEADVVEALLDLGARARAGQQAGLHAAADGAGERQVGHGRRAGGSWRTPHPGAGGPAVHGEADQDVGTGAAGPRDRAITENTS